MRKNLSPEEYLDRLLARGAYPKKDLARRLLARGCSPGEAQSLLDRREELGLLDDGLYARLFIEGRPDWSLRRLMDSLADKGIDRATVRQALDEACIDEDARALSLAREWLSVPLEDRKVADRLERRGFSRSLAWKALRAAKGL